MYMIERFDSKNRISRKESFFGFHYSTDVVWSLDKKGYEKGADVTEEMVEKIIRETNPDYIQYDGTSGGYANFLTKTGWTYPGLKNDPLAVFRKVTARHRISLFIEWPWLSNSRVAKVHPDWVSVDSEGKPYSQSIMSIFSPYDEEIAIPQAKEAIDAYDLDGLWIDSDSWIVKLDWSERARKAFTLETGIREIPRKFGEPHWREWIAFHRREYIKHAKKIVSALKAHKPGFEPIIIWLYLTSIPEPIDVPVNYLGGDIPSGGRYHGEANCIRLQSRYLSSTDMPWDLQPWGTDFGENCGYSTMHACDLMQEAAIVISQGGGFEIDYGVPGGPVGSNVAVPSLAGWWDDWLIKIIAEISRFCRTRQAISHRSTTVPQVALLLSSTSYFDRLDKQGQIYTPGRGPFPDGLQPVSEYKELRGVLHALLELHYSVDVLAEHQIKGKMSSYPVIVLPECEILTQEFQASLLEYVNDGGSLLTIGAPTSALFKKNLGVRFDGDPAEEQTYIYSRQMQGWLGGLWQSVTPTSATCVGTRFPNSDTRKNGKCAATVAKFGKGSIAAIYGPLGDVFIRSHNPSIRNFLGDVLSEIFQPMAHFSGPPCVDVVLRRKDDKLIVHLINVAGKYWAPNNNVPDYIIPVGQLELRLKLPEQPSEVSLVPADAEISTKWSKGELFVKVPSLKIHNAIVIE